MRLDDAKIKYLDNESCRLVELLEELTPKPSGNSKETGSLSHKKPLDINIQLNSYIVRNGSFDKVIPIASCDNGKCIGFNEENYNNYEKFLTAINKDSNINTTVSRQFIEDKTFQWLTNTFRQKRAVSNFSTYLITEIEDSIQDLTIYHFIDYLDIKNPFQIGKVNIGFLTAEFFDKYAEGYKVHMPDSKENPYDGMKESYEGFVYASFNVKAERGKAKEIALKECSLAVDILKICSNTLVFPHLKLSFDIDSRIKESTQSETIIQNEDFIKGLSIDLNRQPTHYKINDQIWDLTVKRAIFHRFLVDLKGERTELQNLILNALRRFASALSNHNRHQRVTELFTILESLLLIDQNSPIIDTVCKYSSKLIFKDRDERKQSISLLKRMYEVRSGLLHHAKELSFKITDLRELQLIVHRLLIKLIELTGKHSIKKTILDEIDDAIIDAY